MANQVFVSIGRNPIPFSESQIYETLSLIATIFMALWAAWKNNSITNEAIIADEIMHDLKEKRKSDSEVH